MKSNETHSCAVFVHWMTELMIFAAASKKEACLTHVEVETFQAAISEAHNWILFTYVAFGLMLCTFSRSQAMQNW